MVRSDRIADVGLLLVFLGELHADDCVRQFGFVVGHLADVVQQTGTACDLGVQPQFGGHDTGQIGRFAGVLQQVLPVGRTVLHLADQADQFGMQAVDAQIDGRALADLDDLLLDLLLHLGDHLLDAGGMDSAVGDELMQRQTGDLAAHGVEAAQDDRFGRVVDDDLDAGSRFQRTDVAPLAADDAALDLVALNIEDRHGVLDGRLGGHALNRGDDDPLGLLRGRQLGLLDRLVDVGGRIAFGFGLHVLDQDVLGILRTHARNLFQTRVLLLHQAVDLLGLMFQQLPLRFHLLFEPFVLAQAVLQFTLLIQQVGLDLLGALLALRELLVALVDLTVVVAFELNEFLLGLENPLLLYHFAFGLRLFEGGFTLRADGILGDKPGHQNIDTDAHNGRNDAR